MSRGPPLTVPALVSALATVPGHEDVEVGLCLLKGLIKLLTESYLVELLLHRLVEPLGTPIGLRMAGHRFRIPKPIQMLEELVGMGLRSAAVFRPTVSQDAKDIYPIFVVEG